MYSYTYDSDSGGLILNSSPTNFSKEPRPVYAPEMDLLGFSKYWNYDKQSNTPYMWAEANVYWYRNVQIAKIKGGDLYTPPELLPARQEDGSVPFGKADGTELKPIDIAAMCRKNEALMTIIEDTTVKKIVSTYEKFKGKLDIFHVAFSGGKDSAVLLDLVKKALPVGSFVVIFGDTGMEFPDTYKVVEQTRAECEKDGTPFYIARSHFEPKESWKLFGPPARVLRWCCSVHKSTPQTLKMRELTGKADCHCLDFVGVRNYESAARSRYEYECFGKKQKGQFSYNPILEWTSAEVWAYIYDNNVLVNEAYKKGNSRAGCICCPMGGGISDYFRWRAYKEDVEKYIGYIRSSYNNPKIADTYIANGGWGARTNGRDLAGNKMRHSETIVGKEEIISVEDPKTDWREWIKTIGDICETDESYVIVWEGRSYKFSIQTNKNGYTVKFASSLATEAPILTKLLRQVFRKANYCGGCRVCETNCRNGCIKFTDGKLTIENCTHCLQCHEIDAGCILYRSLKIPQEAGKVMKSINSFADHAPKRDWFVSFFELKECFYREHSLGPMMFDKFKRFLRDAGLSEKNVHFTPFARLVDKLGWEADTSLGLMLVNLAYNNPQFEWYIKHLNVGVFYERKQIEDLLVSVDVKPKDAKSIAKSFKRIVETPFGTILNFGYASDEDDFCRSKCSISDNRVFLYALYRFVEKCNLHREFNVSYLFDETIERDGVSPVRIFGITDDEELRTILLGLSSRYPEFINATYTNDLQTIMLRDKTSADVLKLFEEEN